MKNLKLQWQLRHAGAGKQEAAELAKLAGRLHTAIPPLDAGVKREVAAQIGVSPAARRFAPRWAFAGAVVLLVIGVGVLGHAAGPGSVLYSIHKTEDKLMHYLHAGEDDTANDPAKKQPAGTPLAPLSAGSQGSSGSAATQPPTTSSPGPGTAPGVAPVSPQILAPPVSNMLPNLNVQIGNDDTGSAGAQVDGNGIKLQVDVPPLLQPVVNGLTAPLL